MLNDSPQIIIIAGPNGSGKSTCGPSILKEHFQISEFVNADVIAAGISAFQPEKVSIYAGRIMLKRLHNLAKQKKNFAFETTISSRSFSQWIAKLKKRDGFIFSLIYFWLYCEDLAVERVAERVRMGGHNIPKQTIRRRYKASIHNFFSLYQPIADNWWVYDNSKIGNPALIANGNSKDNLLIHQQTSWEIFRSKKTGR